METNNIVTRVLGRVTTIYWGDNIASDCHETEGK